MRRIGSAAFGALALCAALPAEAASHRLECPATSPAEWGAPQVRLSGAVVLAAPEGQAIDPRAPPTLIPDDESVEGDTLHQRWVMNGYGPGWHFYVGCRYAERKQSLRLDAAAVTRCDRFVSQFNRTTGASPRSKHTLYCD